MDTINQELAELREKQNGFSDILSSLNVDKMENIKQVIAEINDLITERTVLSSSLINAYESLLTRINGIISRTPQENLKEEIVLHEKAVQVEEAKITEHLNCWRDIAKLKEELREVLREFREQESMQHSYDELLNN